MKSVQRVSVAANFVDDPMKLGDGYRVDVRIVIWESPKVTKAPASALFRSGEKWSAFIVDGGRARSTPVEVGHRNALEAEITNKRTRGGERK